MPKVSNEYTEEDFKIYLEDLFSQIQQILARMQAATRDIIGNLESEDGFDSLEYGSRDVLKILHQAQRDSFCRGHTSEGWKKERDALALRVSKLRRRREKLAKEA